MLLLNRDNSSKLTRGATVQHVSSFEVEDLNYVSMNFFLLPLASTFMKNRLSYWLQITF